MENNEQRKRKPGGGRKPLAVTVARRRLVANKIDEAEASFAFLVDVRDNELEPIQQRTAAAIWVYESVFGKSKQVIDARMEATVDDLGKLSPLERLNRIDELERRRRDRIPTPSGS